MSQILLVTFPLPVVLALAFLLLVLVAFAAVAFSMREPAPVRVPPYASLVDGAVHAERH